MLENIKTLWQLAAADYHRFDALQNELWTKYPDIMFNNAATGFVLGIGMTLYLARSKRGQAMASAIGQRLKPKRPNILSGGPDALDKLQR